MHVTEGGASTYLGSYRPFHSNGPFRSYGSPLFD